MTTLEGENTMDKAIITGGQVMTIYKTISNLQIYPTDIGPFPWGESIKACEGLGDGWRLPTREELNQMYINREWLGDFVTDTYWSSSEHGTIDAWAQLFHFIGYQGNYNKSNTNYVRPVRDLQKETVKAGES